MRAILTILLILLVSADNQAQINSELITQWESSFQEYGDATQVIGMSVAIRTADDLWTDQYGVSAASVPLTEDHLFAMGSVSKTITSATILQMYEEGLLSLEDPIGMYLEPYENIDASVTLRQLLNHTSGIFSYTSHPTFLTFLLSNPELIISPEEVIIDFVLAPDFVAGTDFGYSNTNYVLLGMIIEEIADQTYYEEARERFEFDTNYPSLAIPPYEISPEDLAHLWVNVDGSGVMDAQATGFSLNLLFSGAGAAGAYVASPKDLAQWARDLYTGDLLQPSSMMELTTPSQFNSNYGLGVVMINGLCSTQLAGHSGGIIYTTATYYDTQSDLAITVHTNDGDTETDMAAVAVNLFCIYNDFITSIEEIEDVESLSVYPNPFSDQINISYELTTARKMNLTLLDHTGKHILKLDQSRKSAGVHQEIFDVDLPAGMYVVQLILDDQVTYKKIVKQ